MEKVAILYQNKPPPRKNGIQKPMKLGGYSDSGADIGFCLKGNGIEVITPTAKPVYKNDYDWVFPDSKEGIEAALNKGAKVFWLNTVLYKSHPIERYFKEDIEIVGQLPEVVDKYDDKIVTNEALRNIHLPVPPHLVIEKHQNWRELEIDFNYPLVVKPIRGRGSHGVSVVKEENELYSILDKLFKANDYGSSIYIEHFLPGQEITITVLPPGRYKKEGKEVIFKDYWCLPPVKRFNHENDVAPYNGLVAVVNNSKVLSDQEIKSKPIKLVLEQCQAAAKWVNATSPIRIDCRANEDGQYFLFDLNMKPNMTGASRPHRKNQDSLTMIAARKIGWNYFSLLQNILNQKWKPAHKTY